MILSFLHGGGGNLSAAKDTGTSLSRKAGVVHFLIIAQILFDS